ncbi:shikimate dehydrogenase [Brevibacterium sp. XM4083]|uniref:shikimate dehydrogenase family protein n=1 Tax=Brevibacterium sp. XM4083 TaxID=2583238 RepID=UPI0011291DEE|nr:shikimate dehydrogenase [Brevibacterium sp. XM4083]MCM1012548.1 shikimate dehydrogenase [Brevibacterium sp. XM4083]
MAAGERGIAAGARIRAAVLGRPIAHSQSPVLHTAAFAALSLTDSSYERAEVGADDLTAFLDAHPDHTGFSLTMPLKERLVTLARDRGWVLDDTAEETGVANTLVRAGAETTVANTDVDGIVRALTPVLPDTEAAGRGRATILGAGATARSALLACHRLGVTEVDILVRSPARAAAVLDLADRLGMSADTAPLTTIAPSAIVVSTLPAEAAPALTWPTGPGVALDVAYAADSALLTDAAAHGFTPVPGIAMLVEQAVAQFALFFAAAAGTPLTAAQLATVAEAMHGAAERA